MHLELAQNHGAFQIAPILGDFASSSQKVRENAPKTYHALYFQLALNLGDFAYSSQKVRENAPKTYHA